MLHKTKGQKKYISKQRPLLFIRTGIDQDTDDQSMVAETNQH